MPIFIFLCVAGTYFFCRYDNKLFYRSWVSALAESMVCGLITAMYMRFVSKIYVLIEEIDLDLAPVNTNFFGNVTVVGFLFLISCSDAGMHYLVFGKDAPESGDTFFLIISIAIQLSYFIAYLLLFRLIYNQTKKGRTFDCLILHRQVPELVFLQTRMLLRNNHYTSAEKRRTTYALEEMRETLNEQKRLLSKRSTETPTNIL